MLELAQVALIDDAVHVLAVVLVHADGFVVDRPRRHGDSILPFRLSRYNSVDLDCSSALAFRMKSANGMEP